MTGGDEDGAERNEKGKRKREKETKKANEKGAGLSRKSAESPPLFMGVGC